MLQAIVFVFRASKLNSPEQFHTASVAVAGHSHEQGERLEQLLRLYSEFSLDLALSVVGRY